MVFCVVVDWLLGMGVLMVCFLGRVVISVVCGLGDR